MVTRGRGQLPPMEGKPPSFYRSQSTRDSEPFLGDINKLDYSQNKFSHCDAPHEVNASNAVHSAFVDGFYDGGFRKMSMGRGTFVTNRSPRQHDQPSPSISMGTFALEDSSDEMDSKAADYISKRFQELTCKDNFKISSEKRLSFPFKLGSCSYCNRRAMYSCSKCKAWYCCNSCYVHDQPQHRKICSPRTLVFDKDGNASYKKDIKKVVFAVPEETPIRSKFSNNSFHSDRNPRSSLDSPQYKINEQNGFDNSFENQDSYSVEQSNTENFREGRLSDSKRHSMRDSDKNKNRNSDRDQPKSRGQRNDEQNQNNVLKPKSRGGGGGGRNDRRSGRAHQNSSNNEVYIRSAVSPPEKPSARHEVRNEKSEQPPIPRNKFTEITIGGFGKKQNEFFAYSELKEQGVMMKTLTDICENSAPISGRIEIKTRVCAPFEDGWFRAEILKFQQNKAHVFFIDFGNEAIIDKKDLRPLPPDLAEKPILAHKYILAESSQNPTLSEETPIRVKPIKKDRDGRWVVQVEGVSYNENFEEVQNEKSEQPPIPRNKFTEVQNEKSEQPPIPRNKFTEITIGGFGKKQNEFFAYSELKEQGVMMKTLTDICENSAPISGRIEIKTRVCAPFEDGWFRAEILKFQQNKAHVFFIDFGNEAIIDKKDLRPLPPDLAEKPILAHKYILAESSQNPTLSEETPIRVKPIKKDRDGRWVVQVEGVSYNENFEEVQNEKSEQPPIPRNKFTEVQNEKSEQPPIPRNKFTEVQNEKSEQPPIPRNKFTEITIGGFGKKQNEFFAYSELKELGVMMKTLNDICENSAPISGYIEIKTRVCALFDGDWFRAEILKFQQNKAHVFFIDFGNEAIIDKKDLRPLPPDLAEKPILAHKYILAESSQNPTLSEETPIRVKPIKKDRDGRWVVQVEGVSYNENFEELDDGTLLCEAADVGCLSGRESNEKRTLVFDKDGNASYKKDIKKVKFAVPEETPIRSKFSNNSFHSDRNPRSSLDSPQYKINEQNGFDNSFENQDSYSVEQSNTENFREGRLSDSKRHSMRDSDKNKNRNSDRDQPKSRGQRNDEQNQNNVPKPKSRGGGGGGRNDRRSGRAHQNSSNNEVYIRSAVSPPEKPSARHEVQNEKSEQPPIPRNKFTELDDGTLLCEAADVGCLSGRESNENVVKHLLYSMTKDKPAKFYIEKVMNEDFLTGCIILHGETPYFKEVSDILKKEVSLPTKNMRLNAGMMVAAQWDNDWHRGYVMLIRDDDPIIALIDRGMVVIPQAVAPLPKKSNEIPKSGVRAIFKDPIQDMSMKSWPGTPCVPVPVRRTATARIYERALSGLILNITDARIDGEKVHVRFETKAEAVLVPWEPSIEEAGLSSIKLVSGTKTTISSYISPSAVYVQSKMPEDVRIRAKLMEDLTAHTLKCGNLQRKPLCGEFLAVRFHEDGLYYRAQIFKKQDDRYKVTFVDYGNSELVTISDMKPLSDALKSIPCCAIKVGLKGVPNEPFNKECMEFMNLITFESVDLIITFERDLREVTLSLTDGRVINHLLADLLTPSWNKPDFNPSGATLDFDVELLNIEDHGPTSKEIDTDADKMLSREEVGEYLKKQMVAAGEGGEAAGGETDA